jgi:Secretion system C-terminal sorting domain
LGTYTIVYKICDAADPTKCDLATITILVDIITPATGLELKGYRSGGDVQLNWYTITEQNTSHFIVERSFNGTQFELIPAANRVMAAGNSTDRLNYTVLDRNVAAAVVYYRVKLIDNNGQVRVSNTIAVTQNISRGLRVYPNPVKDMVTVEFGEAGTYQIDLIGNNGQIIMLQKDIQVSNNFRSITLQRNSLITGQYEMRITNRTTGKVNTVKLFYLPNQMP